MAGLLMDLMRTVHDRQRWDSVFFRRVIGGAFIVGLILLGLALPVIT